MLALGLTLLIFIFWIIVGYAVIVALRTRFNLIQNLLLAPSVGLAVTVLAVFWLNRIGLPVKTFGLILGLIMLTGAAFLLWRLRPITPFRRYLPFALVFFLTALIVGRPMLEFNFDWLSYSNDDMANYVLGAHRFLNYGFLQLPDKNALVQGQDFTLIYWFLHVWLSSRAGAELMLAWIVSITGLSGHQAFMPLILAFNLAQISAVGALVCQQRRQRLAALIVCAMLGLSALMALGTLYQLLGQVGGIGLMCGCATVLMQPIRPLARRELVRYALLSGIMVAALLMFYPEVFPFLALAYLCYIGVGLARRYIAWRPLLIRLAVTALASLLIINVYLPVIIGFLLTQFTIGVRNVDADYVLFPFYLLPSGLGDLWGFQNIVAISGEPWLSISIVLGGVLLIVAIISIFRACWKLQPVAFCGLIMLVMAVYLFIKQTDFGLFKLAMYSQPFLIGGLVLLCLRNRNYKRKWLQVAVFLPLALVSLLGLYAQTDYIEKSRGVTSSSESGGGLVEIPGASVTHINSEFQQELSQTKASQVILDTYNLVVSKFQGLYLQGRAKVSFAGMPESVFRFAIVDVNDPDKKQLLADGNIKAIEEAFRQRIVTKNFALFDTSKPNLTNSFGLDLYGQPLSQTGPSSDTAMIITTPKQSPFNRRKFIGQDNNNNNFVIKPWNEVQNQLIFVASNLGQNYYLSTPDKTSIYQLESDPYFKNQTMSGMGRYFLFQTVNPSLNSRLVVNITSSLKNDGENKLPPAAAIGSQRLPMDVMGRGSARVFSPPLNPQMIDNFPYLGIDMGVSGTPFLDSRNGLMNLYGRNVTSDRRKLVGFGRDISLVSDEEYQNMTAPEQVSNFPADLANPNLEYSGVYEDGWISEAGFFGLNQSAGAKNLLIRGVVPQVDNAAFKTQVTVLIDGQEVDRRSLGLGEFELKLAAPAQAGRHRVELRFSNFQRLPGNDKRPVAALLKSIGFTN